MEFAGLSLFAIVLAAVVSFMFGWVWYGVFFSDAWLAAIGKTREDVKGDTPSPMPFAIGFIALFIMAWVLAGVIGHLGPGQVTFWNGIITGALMWLGFVITTLTVNNTFQGAKRTLTFIDGGHWLGVLLLQGATIGWIGV
jgi:hypothetical protein